ncbi:PREDICTED: interactor protein for cytohesin exchange factors 1 isoform X1 [Crocodylus porosus]|uniref:interactor protein for cytohesin exchange factors 1 isoform X1 n=2 Tax=Crocodylus porosus TaxID=8502 RepID=UPI00093FFBC7|nr:PREDICTED: interactor protein for cytohesin exchange factors 1 isoform X1 [Crocodylus porosus]
MQTNTFNKHFNLFSNARLNKQNIYFMCTGICIMSRRRISCKELGLLDCQGWLYKKKEKGAFIGNKWKKFWFVLKGSSLYWYSSQLAEKAEGFINLPDFSVDRATECKKKHAIKINHPQIKTFYFAAENVMEMNMWLNKLGLAVIPQASSGKNEEECYSESEHDDPEITETPPPPYTAQPLPPHSAQQQPSLASSLSSEASCSLSSLESTVKSQESSSSLVSKVIYPERQSWLDIVNSSPAMEEVDQPLTFSVQNHTGEQPQMNCSESVESQQIKSDTGSYDALLGEGTTCLTVPDLVGMKTLAKDWAKCCDNDEMERLYKSLEQASLSPIGDRRPSTKKELRKSFIKRSKNPCINEKLHKIRVLNSTLKCKEHDLAMINQLLEDPELTAEKYRKWRNTNNMLVQDIYQQQEVLYLPEEIRKEEEMNPPPFIGNSL